MAVKNILFIMCDQLRWDYLSCYGHPHLHTPHIDALAARIALTRRSSSLRSVAWMSAYTGRYVHAGISEGRRDDTLVSVCRGELVQDAYAGRSCRHGPLESITPHFRMRVCERLHPWSGRTRPIMRGCVSMFTGENPWEEWANMAICLRLVPLFRQRMHFPKHPI